MLTQIDWDEASGQLKMLVSEALLPYQKLELLLSIVAIIEALYANQVVEAAQEKGLSAQEAIEKAPLCADDLLAIFTHLSIWAEGDGELYHTVEYVKDICSNDLGPRGYYMCVLVSAIEYITNLDAVQGIARNISCVSL